MNYNSRINSIFRVKLMMVNMLFLVALVLLSLLIIYLNSIFGFVELVDSIIHDGISILVILTISFLPVVLFLNQDNVNSSGIVKRVLGVQIVSSSTNLPATPISCFLRNISILFPFDFIFWIMSPSRSIGDYIFGTKLVSKTANIKDATEYNLKAYLQYAINSIIISALIASVITIFINTKAPVSETTSFTVESLNDSTSIHKKYFESGRLNIEYTMVNGKYDGFYKEWSESGNPINLVQYKNGVRDGITTTYYSNGNKEFEIKYENNEFVEYINKWDSQGNSIPIEEYRLK